MPGGHKGVFRRKKHKAFDMKKKPGLVYAKLPKKYRHPIQELYGPSVPATLGDPKVFKPVEEKSGERLKKNINHEMDFELSKH